MSRSSILVSYRFPLLPPTLCRHVTSHVMSMVLDTPMLTPPLDIKLAEVIYIYLWKQLLSNEDNILQRKGESKEYFYLSWPSLCEVMETLREFLESSTIHGLVYISSSKSNVTKFLWACVVIAGFTTAWFLINNSYSDWSENPVSTTISTHPISELKFPKITICPPSGTKLSLIHIWRCWRIERCRSRWSPYH